MLKSLIDEIETDDSLIGPNSLSFKKALIDLDSMVGIERVKTLISKQIKYAIYKKKTGQSLDSMHHTMIVGQPGMGKTMLAQKIGAVYSTLGILKRNKPKEPMVEVSLVKMIKCMKWIRRASKDGHSKGIHKTRRRNVRSMSNVMINNMILKFIGFPERDRTDSIIDDIDQISIDYHKDFYPKDVIFNIVGSKTEDIMKPICKIFTKEDLVSKWVGETCEKTTSCLKSCLGGTFILDEAYQLLNSDDCKHGIESLNTINQFISEHQDEILVIFCGYEYMIQNLYDKQPGLKRRFPWVYKMVNYNQNELASIFFSKLTCDYSQIDIAYVSSKIKDHIKLFKFQGGDAERLAVLSQIELAVSSYDLEYPDHTLTTKHFDIAFEQFVSEKSAHVPERPNLHMYL